MARMASAPTIVESPLSSRDVALLLDVSPDDVNELARRGDLPGFKQGRFWRFRRRDVLRHRIDQGASSTANAAPDTASDGAPPDVVELDLSA